MLCMYRYGHKQFLNKSYNVYANPVVAVVVFLRIISIHLLLSTNKELVNGNL